MLDFFQIKQHRIVFSILAILIGIVIILFIALFASGLVREWQGETSDKTQNTIAFAGEGKVYAKPDIAIVNLSVVTEGKYIKDVQNGNTKKMNKVIDFLKGFGIEEKDIKTINYNIYPKYVYQEGAAPRISGYEISQTLEVKVRDLEKVGEILEGSVGAGINQVNSLRFWIDKDDDLRDQARQMAIEDAKKKAEKSASQLGIKLVKIIGFSENIYGYPYPMYSGYKEYGIGGGGAPDIQTGENEITVNVTIIYEIN